MSPWALGVSLAALLAALSAVYFWFVRRPDAETRAGLQALAALRWREVSSLIRQAMHQRGLTDTQRGPQDPADDGSRLLMNDGEARCLLVCKHGMAYRIGLPAIEELVAAMNLSGARTGILLTQGRAERDAHGIAERNAIEIIDGRRLWPLLKPFMQADAREAIVSGSRRQAIRHASIAVLASIAAGLVVAVSLQAWRLGEQVRPASEATPAAATATTDAAPPAPPPTPAVDPASTAPVTPTTGTPVIEADPDDATQLRYQADIARKISRLPGIGRAHWLTRATLVVDRHDSDDLIWPLICEELDRYPSLRTVRVQLNPRPGHDEVVRWRQCRTM